MGSAMAKNDNSYLAIDYVKLGGMRKAIIMAGGKGTRLKPLNCSKPKPMVYLANNPVMTHTIGTLKTWHH